MLVGHFAVALLAKRVEPRLSLGTAAVAAMLPDLLWPVLMLAGVEQIEIRDGRGAGQYFRAVYIDISHSLVTGVAWALALCALYLSARGTKRAAALLFAAVLSHWVLDVVSHHPDMALVPGAGPRLGLGLWESIPATLLVEGGVWVIAVAAYVWASRGRNVAGRYAFAGGIAGLTFAWYNNIAGPPPRGMADAAIGGLVFFAITIGWLYWMDRARAMIRSSAAPRHVRPAAGPGATG